MSEHGVAALIVGVAGSLFLGIGLMSIVFISSRGRHDQAAYDAARAHFDFLKLSFLSIMGAMANILLFAADVAGVHFIVL